MKCKICKVPLSGLLSKIPKVLFKVKASTGDPEICNKCAKGRKYKCQLCNRMIHEEHSLEHIKAEEYLLSLIQKDHPQWQNKEPTCEECVEYYRKLVKETEI